MTPSAVDEPSSPQSGTQQSLTNAPVAVPRNEAFIDRLPNELLAQIFTARTPPHNDPLDLLIICRHWRDVACGTPVLWSKVVIDFDKTGSLPMDQLPVWINRAGRVPLDVIVHLPEIPGPTDDLTQLPQCIEAVNLIGDRPVSSLEVAGLSYHPPRRVIEALEVLMKPRGNLKSWTIQSTDVDWSELGQSWNGTHADQLAECLLHLASITSLDCAAIFFFAVQPSYPVLQYLSILEGDANSTVARSLSALRDCPSLRTIKYEGYNFDDAVMPTDFKPIFLPHLEHLELIGSLHIEDFLQNVEAPALKQLALTRLSISFDSLEAAFTHFATHPPPLTKMAFRNFNLSENRGPLMSLLRNVPDLVEFEFNEVESMRLAYLEVLMDATACPSMMRIEFTAPAYEESIVDEGWIRTASWTATRDCRTYRIQRPEST